MGAPLHPPSTLSAMKTINSKAVVKIPDAVTCELKSRVVKITGPRGVLTKSFRHMSVDMYMPDDKQIAVEKWWASSKELSVIKTVTSHIQNMIDGVTKGFQYRMKMVYAHFPTNAQIASNGKENTQLLINGNDIENVSRTCALISQSCAVKKKDIRKFLDGIYVSDKTFHKE